jgi:hypothetical protein
VRYDGNVKKILPKSSDELPEEGRNFYQRRDIVAVIIAKDDSNEE